MSLGADPNRQTCLDLFGAGAAEAARRRMLLWLGSVAARHFSMCVCICVNV